MRKLGEVRKNDECGIRGNKARESMLNRGNFRKFRKVEIGEMRE